MLTIVAAPAAAASIDMQVDSWVQSVQGPWVPTIKDPVPVNGKVQWDIQVENSNTLEAPGATLSVPLGSTFTFVSATSDTGSCSHNTGTNTVLCSFGTLPAAAVVGSDLVGKPVKIVVVLTPTVVNAYDTEITVATTGTDGNPANNKSKLTTTVVESADLSIASFTAAPSPVFGGDQVSYSVVVHNGGLYVASDAKLTFTLPVGLDYVSATGSSWSCATSGQTVTCTYPSSIANGVDAPTLTWKGRVSSGIEGTLTSLASVSSTTLDSDGNNNSGSANVTVKAGADLKVTKSISANPVIGSSDVTFTVQVDNLGSFTATGLALTDDVPAPFTAVAASGAGWDCSASAGNHVDCKMASLVQGSATPILITAKAPNNAYIKGPPAYSADSNTATITSTSHDPIAGNNSSTVNFTVKQDGPDLAIAVERSLLPIPINSGISTKITVTNNGPSPAVDPIPIYYTLATDEMFVSASSGWDCTHDAVMVECHLNPMSASLAVGASVSMDLVTKKSSAGTVAGSICTGQSASYTTDIEPSNDCANPGGYGMTVTADQADLVLTKAVASPVPSAHLTDTDSTITYTLTVKNLSSTTDATSVVLTDPIPMYSDAYAETTPARAATTVAGTWSDGAGGTGGCSGGGTLTCAMGTVKAGKTTTVTVTVARPMKDGAWINKAYVYSLVVGDPTWSNNNAEANITVDAVTDIELTQKIANPNPVKAGVETTYVISIRNNGPSPAENVKVTDTFTVNGVSGTFTFVSASASDGASCGAYNSGANSVQCTFGTVPAFGVRSMTVKIRPDHIAGYNYGPGPGTLRKLNNDAVVTTSTKQSNTTNDSKSATLDITGALVDLLIQDVDLLDPVPYDSTAGVENRIIYQVDIKNIGPSYSTGVAFVSSLTPPAGHSLTFLCALTSATQTKTASSDCTGAVGPTCTDASCTIGDLAANETKTRYMVYKINEEPAATGSSFVHKVDVASNEPETLLTNNHASQTTTARILADRGGDVEDRHPRHGQCQ